MVSWTWLGVGAESGVFELEEGGGGGRVPYRIYFPETQFGLFDLGGKGSANFVVISTPPSLLFLFL